MVSKSQNEKPHDKLSKTVPKLDKAIIRKMKAFLKSSIESSQSTTSRNIAIDSG